MVLRRTKGHTLLKSHLSTRSHSLLPVLLALLAAGALSGCGSSTESDPETPAVVRGPEWVESTHGKLEDPDTTGAFPISARRTIVLSFQGKTWDTILANMTTACGVNGTSASCTGSGLDLFASVSAWHEADLLTDGQKWASVGIRLRSNSELADAWKAKTNRFPFRITTDKWENERPSIDNQRFYGFQKLSLNSLADDSSMLRHQVSSAVYRSHGVPAFRSTLVNLKVAHGSGINDTLDLGIYSLREQIDGPMLSRWFSGNDGNLYEPSSMLAASDATNSAAFSGDGNDKTYTDVFAFMAALHNPDRTTAPASWRTRLQGTFDVTGFVNWLALSTVLGDRGGYGNENDNYALYADGGKLRWMALDLDQTIPTGVNGPVRSVWHQDEIAAGASLIKHVLADSVLCEQYRGKVASYATTELGEGRLAVRVSAVASQLLPGSTSAAKLEAYATVRKPAIDTSLANNACPRN